jgi:hypothetical protein
MQLTEAFEYFRYNNSTSTRLRYKMVFILYNNSSLPLRQAGSKRMVINIIEVKSINITNLVEVELL